MANSVGAPYIYHLPPVPYFIWAKNVSKNAIKLLQKFATKVYYVYFSFVRSNLFHFFVVVPRFLEFRRVSIQINGQTTVVASDKDVIRQHALQFHI